MAYDLTGDQTTVLRGGGGLFYDRPDGNTVFSIPGNPPIATRRTFATASCRRSARGLSILPNPQLVTFQYDAKVPAQWQWQAGMQRALPWSIAIDISYVGNHGYNRLGALQGGSTVNLNAVDIGAAYLPQNQDLTMAAKHAFRARSAAPPTCSVRLSDTQHQPEPDRVLGHLPLAADVAEPPVQERVLVRCELHLRDLVPGNLGLQQRFVAQCGRLVPTPRRPGRVREAEQTLDRARTR